jgi:hypothetical protein
MVRPHVALKRRGRELGVGDQALFGSLPDEDLAIVVQSDDAGRETGAEHVLDEVGRALSKHPDQAEGGAKVDADYRQVARQPAPKPGTRAGPPGQRRLG